MESFFAASGGEAGRKLERSGKKKQACC